MCKMHLQLHNEIVMLLVVMQQLGSETNKVHGRMFRDHDLFKFQI